MIKDEQIKPSKTGCDEVTAVAPNIGTKAAETALSKAQCDEPW